MDIVCFGQQNWEGCWTGKQQLMTELGRRGHRILFVGPRWNYDTGLRWKSIGSQRDIALAEVEENVFVFRYVYAPMLRWQGNVRRMPKVLARTVSYLGLHAPAALALRPSAAAEIDALQPAALAYYAIDEMTAHGERDSAERFRIRAAEEALVRRADKVFAISERLLLRLQKLHPDITLLPSGADVAHFAALAPPHPEMRSIPGTRLLFIGQLDERLDQELLSGLCRRHPEWSFVFAGRVKDGVDFGKLRAFQNVRFLGYRTYEELPALLAGADAAIAPYKSTELTESSSPLKVYEYMAAGKPVVASRLQTLSPLSPFIHLAEREDEWEAAIVQSISEGKNTEKREARRAFVERNSWERRADLLEQKLLELEPQIAAVRTKRFDSAFRRRPHWPRLHRELSAPALSRQLRVFASLVHAAGQLLYLVRTARRGARTIQRILVARRGRLGDFVVFLPALRLLRAIYPDAYIVLGVQRGASVQGLIPDGLVDEIRVLEHFSASGVRHNLLGTLRMLLEGFDLVISGSWFFIFPEALLSGAPYRIGLYDGHPYHTLHTHHLLVDPTVHESENNMRLIEAFSVMVRPKLADDSSRVEQQEYIVVHPGANKPSHCWPVPYFSRLINLILQAEPGRKIILTGSLPERGRNQDVLSGVEMRFRSRVENRAGETDLPMLQETLQKARVVIVGDTGVMHLARELGSRLLVILGSENHRRWGPAPDGRGIAVRAEVPCAPCRLAECASLYCLKALTPETLFEQYRRLPEVQGLEILSSRRRWEELCDIPSVLFLQGEREKYLFRYPKVQFHTIRTEEDLRRAIHSRADYIAFGSGPLRFDLLDREVAELLKRPDVSVRHGVSAVRGKGGGGTFFLWRRDAFQEAVELGEDFEGAEVLEHLQGLSSLRKRPWGFQHELPRSLFHALGK